MQFNVRISAETRRMVDALVEHSEYSEGEIASRGVRMLYNALIGPITLMQLRGMCREALESWDFESADSQYENVPAGLRHILDHEFSEDAIRKHVSGPSDWVGLQTWAMAIGADACNDDEVFDLKPLSTSHGRVVLERRQPEADEAGRPGGEKE